MPFILITCWSNNICICWVKMLTKLIYLIYFYIINVITNILNIHTCNTSTRKCWLSSITTSYPYPVTVRSTQPTFSLVLLFHLLRPVLDTASGKPALEYCLLKFLYRTLISQTLKSTINKWDLMKVKSFYKAKDTWQDGSSQNGKMSSSSPLLTEGWLL